MKKARILQVCKVDSKRSVVALDDHIRQMRGLGVNCVP